MKLNEITNRHAKIEALLQRYEIKKYTIQPDGTVDVNGTVSLSKTGIVTLPFKFGIVTGDFNCERCPKLTSLVGAPSSVGGNFSCLSCPKLTSLEGFDSRVSKAFYCDWPYIKSGGISLILSGATELHDARDPFLIIEKYLGRPEDIFDCQMELIDSGYEEYAKL